VTDEPALRAPGGTACSTCPMAETGSFGPEVRAAMEAGLAVADARLRAEGSA
jgi:hypothetical protein